jgi:hypothetical protein
MHCEAKKGERARGKGQEKGERKREREGRRRRKRKTRRKKGQRSERCLLALGRECALFAEGERGGWEGE